MLKKIFVVVVMLLVAAPAMVSAEVSSRMPSVRKRQHRQARRINQGVRSGRLTAEEAKSLRDGQKEVRAMKKEARADGVVTREERREVQRKLNEESREIYQEKHDGETK